MSTNTDDMLAALGGTPAGAVIAEQEPAATPSSHYSPGASTGIEEKALALLGSGVQAESVASALGVTPARISQLLAEESFATRVAALRYEYLQKHNIRDGKYDSLEDELLVKLKRSLPLLIKPESILKAISIVNNAKRRGQSAPQQTTNQQNIVQLVMPTVIAEKFSINIHNQVTKAGGQELLTMASGNLLKQVEDAEDARLLEGTTTPEQPTQETTQGNRDDLQVQTERSKP